MWAIVYLAQLHPLIRKLPDLAQSRTPSYLILTIHPGLLPCMVDPYPTSEPQRSDVRNLD